MNCEYWRSDEFTIDKYAFVPHPSIMLALENVLEILVCCNIVMFDKRVKQR